MKNEAMKFSGVCLLSLIKCRLNIAPFVRRRRQHTKDVCILFRKKRMKKKPVQNTWLCKLHYKKTAYFRYTDYYLLSERFSRIVLRLVVFIRLLFCLPNKIWINSHPGEYFNCHFITIARIVKQQIYTAERL